MRIRGIEITEGVVLAVLGLIFCSAIAGIGYRYRHEIAWMRFMMDTGNVFELVDRFEKSGDPAVKLDAALKISFHSAKNSTAQLKAIAKSIEKNEPLPQDAAEPTGREGAIIKKALEYVEWAYSLVDYYRGKVPTDRISELMRGAREKLKAGGFEDDYTDQEISQLLPSFGKVKPCTIGDFDAVIEAVGKDNVLKFSTVVFAANIRFSTVLGAEAGGAVLRESIQYAESDDHRKILNTILKIHELRPILDDNWIASKTWENVKDASEVKKLVMPFRRAAIHCFQTKNYRAFMDLQSGMVNEHRARNLAESLASHIRRHGQPPARLEDLRGLEFSEKRDVWYSDFKFDRTQTEIVISSIGKDRKAGTEDDFVVYRREFIFGGE